MPNPASHILYGYLIGKNLADKKKLVLFSILSALIVDIDGLHIPGLSHHGITHTPFFALVFCTSILLITRSKLIFKISLFNMMLHITLDVIVTTIPVMLFYPFSSFQFALGTHLSLYLLYSLKIIVFLIPTFLILFKYTQGEMNPLELFRFMKERVGEIQTYMILVSLSVITGYIWVVDYLLKVL